MKKIVLATSLVLGLSSAAFAKPVAPGYAPPAPGLHDHGMHRPLPLPASWTMLSSSAALNARGRALVDVSTNARFQKLKLESSSLFVDKIMIVFQNGKTQTVDLDKRLSRYDSSLTIDLEGRGARKIDKIVVYGKNARIGGWRQPVFKLMAI